MTAVTAIILAAGKSTRMKSAQVKVLHEICGRPMLAYVLDAVRKAGVERIIVVVGHDKQRVMDYFSTESDIQWIDQGEPKGTGHAVQACRSAMDNLGGSVFVLAGDGPLIRTQTLEDILQSHRQQRAALTLATSILHQPDGYGRILRDAAGNVLGIVEEKDATPDQRVIKEVNPSYYLYETADLFSSLEEVKPNNLKGEYYLTDTVKILNNHGKTVSALAAVAPEDVLSINSRKELADVTRLMQSRIQEEVMATGVTLISPENTWIEFGAKIGQDTVLEPFTWVGSGACILERVTVPAGTVIPRGATYR